MNCLRTNSALKRTKSARALVFLSTSLAYMLCMLCTITHAMEHKKPSLKLDLAMLTTQAQKPICEEGQSPCEEAQPRRPKTTSLVPNFTSFAMTRAAATTGAKKLSKTISLPNMAALIGAGTPTPHTPSSPIFSWGPDSPAVYTAEEYQTFCRAQKCAALCTHLAQRAVGTQHVQAACPDAKPIATALRSKKNILLITTDAAQGRLYLTTEWGYWRICDCGNDRETCEKAAQEIIEILIADKAEGSVASSSRSSSDSEREGDNAPQIQNHCLEIITEEEKKFYEGQADVQEFMNPLQDSSECLRIANAWHQMKQRYNQEQKKTLQRIEEDHE